MQHFGPSLMELDLIEFLFYRHRVIKIMTESVFLHDYRVAEVNWLKR